MSVDLNQMLKATLDTTYRLKDLLEIFREAILSDDNKIRDFAVDSMLYRAGSAFDVERTEFYEHLRPSEDYIRAISWLAHPSGRPRGFDEVADAGRRRTVMWLIEHYPESAVFRRCDGRLNYFGDDAAYAIAVRIWRKKYTEFPNRTVLYANAGYFRRRREPAVSRELFSVCVKQEPLSRRWRRCLADLEEELGSSTGSDAD